MRRLTQSVALALPQSCEQETLAAAVATARNRKRQVEVRIGVGALASGMPLRVLGHAACVAETLRCDVATAVRAPDRVTLFSSASKVGGTDGQASFLALATLAGALVLAGVETPITMEFADDRDEVWPDLVPPLPPSLHAWLQRASLHSGNGADPVKYAVEHAAASMFGDIEELQDPPLRITIGSTPEARFWAVRRRVRQLALQRGCPVVPAIGLILKALRVPWYYPLSCEPQLIGLLTSPDAALMAIDNAANPLRGGNVALSREARATRRLAARPGALELAAMAQNPRLAARFIRAREFLLGERLSAEIRRFE